MMSFFIVLVAGMDLKLSTLNAKNIFAMINHVIKLYPETDD